MSKRKKGDAVHGWLFFNKPEGMTSSQAVGFVRWAMNAQKAGHGGTLDPLATGVLPIALGEATKTMPYLVETEKFYRFTVAWGTATDTDDKEGETIATSAARPTRDEIEDTIPHFLGDIKQTPPQFSAIKIAGQPAYKKARAGEEMDLAARPVTIHRLVLIEADDNTATFEAHVSKGTYVRAIARDMGQMLGCYGHIITLARTQVGPFTLDATVDKKTLDLMVEKGEDARALLQPVDVVLDDIPVYRASVAEARQLLAGREMVRVHLKPGPMRVKTPDGSLVSMVEVGPIGELKIVRNFNM